MGNTAQYQAISTEKDESSKVSTESLAENKRGTTSTALGGLEGGKKQLLTEQLKAKYKLLLKLSHSIPFIRDRLHSTGRIFVQGGIEMLATSWLPLESYNTVLRDRNVKTKLYVIQGDEGYGKTTIAYQYLYDWCNSSEESCLKDVEILIFLQLRQVTSMHSIQKAIRQLLLPRDSELNEKDIETVLQSSSSVVVVLDGLDENQDKNLQRSDIMKIITSQMFSEFEVIATTKYLPEQHKGAMTRLRLTGFDDKAQDDYIRKAVVGDETLAADRIKRRIRENPFLGDLSQIPFFFVIVAHIIHDNEDLGTLNTVTSFFKYMIECFHNHVRDESTLYDLNEDKDSALEKVAFDCLSKRSQQAHWRKAELLKRLGDDCYHHYVRTGFLVEEDVCSERTSGFRDFDQWQTQVTFSHNLFCEWYAAQHLAMCATDWTYERLKKELQHIKPNRHEYFYRFTCGLNQFAAGKIIEYVKENEGGQKLPALCILEQGEQVASILDTVRDFCSREITLEKEPNKLLQRSIVRVLEIASSNEIPILCVRLYDCYRTVDSSVGCIHLKFNATVPILATLKKLWIRETGRKIAKDEFEDILRYSSLCVGLKKLWFWGCLLPHSVHADTLSVLRSRGVEVMWRTDNATPNHVLNLESGLWENEENSAVMTDDDYEILVQRREWVTLLMAHFS